MNVRPNTVSKHILDVTTETWYTDLSNKCKHCYLCIVTVAFIMITLMNIHYNYSSEFMNINNFAKPE